MAEEENREAAFWPAPDYSRMKEKGIPEEAIFMQYTFRQELLKCQPPKEEDSKGFDAFCREVKRVSEELTTIDYMEFAQLEMMDITGVQIPEEGFSQRESADLQYRTDDRHQNFVSPGLAEAVCLMNRTLVIRQKLEQDEDFRKALLTTPAGKPAGFFFPSLACIRASFSDFGMQV